MPIENRLRDMNVFRQIFALLLLVALTATGCSNADPELAASEDEPQADAPAVDTVAPGLKDFQGLWELTNAPGLEDGLGTVLWVADGPEDGDRFMSLDGDGGCIEWYDYEFVGSTITTGFYNGEIPMEGCDPEPPAFAELFDFGSELDVTVEGNNLRIEAQGSVLEFDRTTNNLFDAFIFESEKPEGATFNYILTNRLGSPVPSGDPDFPQFRVRINAVTTADGSVDHAVWMWNSDASGSFHCATRQFGTARGLTLGSSTIEFDVLPAGWELAADGCDRDPVDLEWLSIFAGEFEFTYAPSQALIRVNYGDDQRAFFIEAPQ